MKIFGRAGGISVKEDTILQQTKHLFENAYSCVLCCDEEWNLLWQNQICDLEFGPSAPGSDIRKILPFESSTPLKHCTGPDGDGVLMLQDNPQGYTTCFVLPICAQGHPYFLLFPQRFRETETNRGCQLLNSQEEAQRFLTLLSGEYRSPLFRIFNLLEPVSRTLELHEEYEAISYIKQISLYCYKLMRTTINLTEYGKMAQLTSPAQLRRVNLNLLLGDICHSVELFLRDTSNKFEYQITKDPIISQVDEERLLLALMNLISNSCLYSRPGNKVSVTLKKQNANFLLTVADTGAGISSDRLPHVFDPFFSCDPNGRPYSGLGLGLPIVKQVAESLSGVVYLTSEENTGTTVTMKIPIQDDPQVKGRLKSASANYLTNKFSTLYVFLADISNFLGQA